MRDFLDDLYELVNNLDDDLKLDLVDGEFGYKSYEESYKAIKKYTLEVLQQKINKWELVIKTINTQDEEHEDLADRKNKEQDNNRKIWEAMQDHDIEGCGKELSKMPDVLSCGKDKDLNEITIYCKECMRDFIQEGEESQKEEKE